MESRAAEVLFQLIEQRLMPGADVNTIDEKIWAMFGETWAVMCSDMTGFTLRTEQFGIIHFLSLIYEMQRLLNPIILEYNGLLLKTEADNLFIIFRSPEQAVHCALAMHKSTQRYNENKTADYQILLSIGIGYGKVLKIGDQDCFGGEVNRAFKLGEDVARGGETLLTPNTYEAVSHENLRFESVTPTTTALLAHYYRLLGEP
ncbi:MAG: adenylate/guanylate cyclase domain-containing protein [Acidobacteriota bacterium]